MSDKLDFENGFLSFANPNYQLDPSDINSNLESVEDYDDLYEEFDTVCRYNRRSGIKSRRNYAQLDSASMGVEIEPETLPMLTADSDNNLKPSLQSSTFESDTCENENIEVDSNENCEMGRRSNFLDYYISLESSTWPQKQIASVQQTTQCSSSGIPKLEAVAKKGITATSEQPVNSENDVSEPKEAILDDSGDELLNTTSCKDQQMPSLCNIPYKYSSNHNPNCEPLTDCKENETLPSGWEKHEDDSGPYYWHISSGTIQREPPPPYSNNCKISSASSKEIDMISSISDFSLNPCKQLPILTTSGGIQIKSMDNKFKRRSYPAGSCSLTPDKRPIRFAVRSLGWVEIAEDDLTPEKSSKAVNKCIVDLSIGRNDILDVVGRWGDGKDLFMDLDDYSLRLVDTQDFTVLNTQPIHTIRVWGVGRDNGRDFAYVARDRITRKYMCHVFRCDIPARIIANTLRDICKKIMIERSSQQNLAKQVIPGQISNGPNVGGPTRPTDFSSEQNQYLKGDSQSSYVAQSFPTPMEEPKKVLKAYYLGTTNVTKATGVEVLNDAIEQLSELIPPADYKYVNVAVAPSTITVLESGEGGKLLVECRVRFLSFLGIGRNIKHCGFIVHTAQDEFVAHVFYCEPSSGALCKTIEAACKLRYQKCLDAHRQIQENKSAEAQGSKSIGTTIRSILGSISRLTKSVET